MAEARGVTGPAFTEALDLASERLGEGGARGERRVLRAEGEPAQGRESGVPGARVHRSREVDGWAGRRAGAGLQGSTGASSGWGCQGSSAGSSSIRRSSGAITPSTAPSRRARRGPTRGSRSCSTRGRTGSRSLPRSPLAGDSQQNAFELSCASRFTHLRLNIYPDGGVGAAPGARRCPPRRSPARSPGRGDRPRGRGERRARALVQRHVLRGAPQPHHARPARRTWETAGRRGSGGAARL